MAMSSTSKIAALAALWTALGLAAGLAGCAVPQEHLSSDFGQAVRQDVVGQIADPDARYKGDPAPGANGAKVAGAQDRYRTGKVIAPSSAGASTIGATSAPTAGP
jgi:hypothetical protein